jgi:hypothetical protein
MTDHADAGRGTVDAHVQSAELRGHVIAAFRRALRKLPSKRLADDVADEMAPIIAALEAEAASLRELVKVIHKTVRGDEKSECWTIRKWLDKHDSFNGDISSSERLIEQACKLALRPVAPERTEPHAHAGMDCCLLCGGSGSVTRSQTQFAQRIDKVVKSLQLHIGSMAQVQAFPSAVAVMGQAVTLLNALRDAQTRPQGQE